MEPSFATDPAAHPGTGRKSKKRKSCKGGDVAEIPSQLAVRKVDEGKPFAELPFEGDAEIA